MNNRMLAVLASILVALPLLTCSAVASTGTRGAPSVAAIRAQLIGTGSGNVLGMALPDALSGDGHSCQGCHHP